MLTRVVLSMRSGKEVLFRQFRRNLGVTAVCCQKAAANLDPIQQLFVDKIREYTKKKQTAGGKLVDATPELEKSMQSDLEKIQSQYGAAGQDFTKFPTFNFTDPELEQLGVDFVARAEDIETVDVTTEAEDDDDKPYWMP